MLNDVKCGPILILSSRPWHKDLGTRLSASLLCKVVTIGSRENLTIDVIQELDPSWIFVPHWSYLIPKSIWNRWPTVIFHMTDLPYGRGGSPLQNLIKSGHLSTVITALRCDAGLDAGDIYFKQPLSLHGTAEEIFLRADGVIEQMIEFIVREEPAAKPQHGDVVVFNRRSPAQSNLSTCPDGDLSAWYDQIRMLDAEGYPYAFLEVQGMRLEFRRISQRSDGLHADVRITSLKLYTGLPPRQLGTIAETNVE